MRQTSSLTFWEYVPIFSGDCIFIHMQKHVCMYVCMYVFIYIYINMRSLESHLALKHISSQPRDHNMFTSTPKQLVEEIHSFKHFKPQGRTPQTNLLVSNVQNQAKDWIMMDAFWIGVERGDKQLGRPQNASAQCQAANSAKLCARRGTTAKPLP